MTRYSKEFKEAVVKKMLPPENTPIAKLAEETGVTAVTLYKWRNEIRAGGKAAPGNGNNSDKWSPEDKFLIVLETHGLNEADFSEYCRSRGLYPEEVESWRDACLHATGGQTATTRDLQREIRSEKKKRKDLEKELRRKEKALAETAALLTLRKKAQAIWGDEEGE